MKCKIHDWLVRELFTENRDTNADPRQDGLGEGGPDGQAVNEVVDAVAEDDHPSDRRDFRSSILRFEL